jgi:hypothetical protein
MDEDTFYRSSTQFRLWSFTRSQLEAIRDSTNKHAAQKVRIAKQKATAAENGSDGAEVDCLTVEEELKLISYYCVKTIELGKALGLPGIVPVSVQLVTFSWSLLLKLFRPQQFNILNVSIYQTPP